MKKLNERRVNPDLLKLNRSQKRVLMKIAGAGDPKRAAEDIAASEDSKNLIAAVKVMTRYGLVATFPSRLGPDETPSEVMLTNIGEEHAADYNVTEDPSLRTQKEQAASAPTDQPAETNTGEQEMGLELSSFFHEIHNRSHVLEETNNHNITYGGFELEEEKDREDDNVKIFHFVYGPNGRRLGTLDFTPYDYMDEDDFKIFVDFFNLTGRFPNRSDLKQHSPLRRRDLDKLLS